MEPVRDHDAVASFALDEQLGLGDEPLERALGALVPWPVGLVREQQASVAQMRVEPSPKVHGGGDVKTMLAEDAAQRPAEETLSGSSSALENERHLGRSGGV